MTQSAASEYILYVGQDAHDGTRFCPGSRRALRVLDDAPGELSQTVNVQTVERLREWVERLPVWLTGTPTLVCKQSRKAYRGARAIGALKALATAGDDEVDRQQQTVGAGDGRGDGELLGMMPSGVGGEYLGHESNYEGHGDDDTSKYTNAGKVTESDLQGALARRRAAVPEQAVGGA